MSNGSIVQSIGAVVDIEFPRDRMPHVYDALVLEADPSNRLIEQGLTFEVQHQLCERVGRTLALGSSYGLNGCMQVRNTGEGIKVHSARPPLEDTTSVMEEWIDEGGPIKTDERR